MTVLRWVCSVPLIAEFAVAPFNLWSGRTMPNFVRFTGLPPNVARQVLSPLKLTGALLIAVGLAVDYVGAAGAALIALVSGFYLVRMIAGRRYQLDGLCAFGMTLILAAVVFAIDLAR